MKQKLSILPAFFSLCGLLSGCAGSLVPPEAAGGALPVRLYARGGALEGTGTTTTTRTAPGEAFTASVAFTSASGQYAPLTGMYEGVWTADVDASGKMEWNTGGGISAPVYPPDGAYLYLAAIAPAATLQGGTATYTLTGQQDLLYAGELRGCMWDGERFSGNTYVQNDRPLLFTHLLTRLQFKACKGQTANSDVRITRITVNEAKTQAAVPLATGVPSFSGSAGMSLVPSDGSVTSTTPAYLGSLMLPPAADGEAYTLTVETSVGTYSHVQIAYDNGASGNLQAGISHEVTLRISYNDPGPGPGPGPDPGTDPDPEPEPETTPLTITVAVGEWTVVNAGNLEIEGKNEEGKNEK